MQKLIAAFLILFAAHTTIGRDTYFVHVRGKDEDKNVQVTKDLNTIRDGFNYRNNSHDSHYYVQNFDTFDEAKAFIDGLQSGVTIGVFHGQTDLITGEPNGLVVQKIGDPKEATDVVPLGNRDVSCYEGKVPIGKVIDEAIRLRPDDRYPSSSSDNGGGGGGGSGGGTAGRYITFFWYDWVIYVQPNGHYASYRVTMQTSIWTYTNGRPPGSPSEQI